MELRKHVISGMMWTSADKLGSAFIQIVVSVLIMRLLPPGDYGMTAMLTIFVLVGFTFVDGGFAQALIRKQHPTKQDFTSVFYLNIAVAGLLYGLLFLLREPIAQFFKQPLLTVYAPYVFLTLPLFTLGLVQNLVLEKQYRFKLIACINISATVVSCVAGVALAYLGHGIWALISMPVVYNFTRTSLLWIVGGWSPTRDFNLDFVRESWDFSSRTFLNNLLNTLFNSVPQAVIGRWYGKSELGLYNQSTKFRDTPVQSISTAISSVMFPTLSSIQNDMEKMRTACKKILTTLSFLIFPLMIGLIATAPEIFSVLSQKWIDAVPYFQILCLTGLFVPVLEVNLTILKIKAPGRKILHLGYLRKGFMAVALLLTAFVSVEAIAWAMVACVGFDAVVYAFAAKRYLKYPITQLAKDLSPYLLLSGLMAVAVLTVGWLLPATMSDLGVLIVKITTGIIVYVGLALVFRVEALRETIKIVARKTTS